MALNKPIYIVGLFVIILCEIAYITIDYRDHSVYFRDFMDAAILLTSILSAYFVYYILKVRKLAPNRGAPPVPPQSAKERSKAQTDKQVQALMKSQAFKKYEQNKQKNLKRNISQDPLNTDVEDFIHELNQKQTQIFDQ